MERLKRGREGEKGGIRRTFKLEERAECFSKNRNRNRMNHSAV